MLSKKPLLTEYWGSRQLHSFLIVSPAMTRSKDDAGGAAEVARHLSELGYHVLFQIGSPKMVSAYDGT